MSKKYTGENALLYVIQKLKTLIPTKTSNLENDSGFITSSDIPEGAAGSNTPPKMDGVATVGNELAFARGDHIHPKDTTKVDVVAGKGLSTNDLTNELKKKYDAAEKNVIVGVQKNGTDLVPDANRKVNLEIPTKTSELNNDSGWITADEVPETYVLPDATTAEKGGVIIGANIDVNAGKISIKDGSTTQKGVVKLSTAIDSTSTSEAATASAVKAAYDLASTKQAPATSLAGYGITDAYTKGEIDGKIAGVYHYKGTKLTYADLPTTGQQVGDTYNIETADDANGVKAGDNVAWNGTGWDNLTGIVDLSAYIQSADLVEITNEEIDALFAM